MVTDSEFCSLMAGVCAPVTVRVESVDSPFTSLCHPGQLLTIPVAHGEGCFHADPATLKALEENDRVLLRYVDANTGEVTEALKKRPERVHVICTGRNAHPLLTELADLVTEMREVKHPYTKGILAQRGIGY